MTPPRALTSEERRALVERGRRDPVWWVDRVLGVRIFPIQADLARSLTKNRVTLAKTCHAVGKTFIAGAMIHWWCGTAPDRMAITTATTSTQSKRSVWEEISRLEEQATKAGRPTGAKVLTTEARWPRLRSSAFARTVPKSQSLDKQATMFHGTRAPGGTLVVIDEATGIPSGIFTGAKGILTGAHDRLLILCNPTDPASEVARMFRRESGHCITMDAFKSPNIAPYGVTIDDIASGAFAKKVPPIEATPFPYLTHAHWVREVWEEWTDRGLRMHDPRWISRVMAQFPEEGDDVLIPMPWIEAAFELYTGTSAEPPEYGQDVADRGDDSTVICERRGPQAKIVRRVFGQDVMASTAAMVGILEGNRTTKVKVDSIGVGAGVWARLKEQGYRAIEVNVARSDGIDREKYKSARSQYLWELRQRFFQAYQLRTTGVAEGPHIELERDEKMATQLNAIKWRQNSAGQIEVESKDETKKRLGGKSPDDADALMLAFVPGAPEIWVL